MGLRDIANRINNEGLPDTESMRADIEANERLMLKNKIEPKLKEYTALFNRFKDGDELTEDEVSKMANLSDELNKLSEEFKKYL